MDLRFRVIVLLLGILFNNSIIAQNKSNEQISSDTLLPKVKHAEPLFNDIMRDLGARKGEAEWNVGFGIADYKTHTEYFGFIEYEWAVADRWGLEVEVPFSFNKTLGMANPNVPNNRIEGVKLATQYTFLVNEEAQLSMGVGYIHEFELNYLKNLDGDGPLFIGMRMNPMFIAAKNFCNFSAMLIAGPVFENHFHTGVTDVLGTVNASIMYVVPGTQNFVGIENNMDFDKDNFQYYLRPQVKVGVLHNLAIGLVTGIPVSSSRTAKMDFLTRIIWEP